MALSHKLFFYLTQMEESIITEKLISDKSSDDIMGYVLDFLRRAVINTKSNAKGLLQQYNLTQNDVDATQVGSDPKFVRPGAKKKCLVLAGTVLINGLQWDAQFQTCVNKIDGKRVFTSFEDYLNVLISEHVESIVVDNFADEINKETKKSKAILTSKK